MKILRKLAKISGLWNVRFVRQLYKKIMFLDIAKRKERTLSFLGVNIHGLVGSTGLFSLDELYANYGITEFIKIAVTSDVIVDIGANIGIYSLLASKFSKASTKIYALEPDEFTFKILSKNIAINEFKNIEPCMVGMSSEKGKMPLYIDKYNRGNNSLVKDNVPDLAEQKSIEVITLDSFVKTKKLERIDLLKIDVQGMEIQILKGAITTLKKQKINNIFMELWPLGIKNTGQDNSNIYHLLNNLGYKFFDVGKRHPEPIHNIERLMHNLADKNTWTDILCTLK